MPFSVSGGRPGHFDIRLVLVFFCVNLDCPKSALCLIEQDQIEPLVNRNSSSDSDLDHYLLDPDGIYLEN